MPARPPRAPDLFLKLLLLVPLALLTGACLFDGGSDGEDPAATATAPARPAIGRSSVQPTPTPQARTNTSADPQPARAPGEISVTYTLPFIWPAEGPITSFMGPEHPNGIDIGLDGSEDRQIRAAARGTVIEAGGNDEEPLGISIVIDHGNGVTTVYGHLSELRVDVGDEVEAGDVIAIGGSTGISTGDHLHLEVRKDGATVDPLRVLPSGDSDRVVASLDCSGSPITLPSGVQAMFDFASVLRDGETIAGSEAVPLSGSSTLQSSVLGRTRVLVTSPINFHGPDGLDSYDLQVTLRGGGRTDVLNCPFAVALEEVPTTFYVRVNQPEEDDEEGEASASAEEPAPTETPAPEPTPTPNPWAQTPSYGIPTVTPGGAQAPGQAAPGVQSPGYGGGGVSGPAVQSPSYGIQ